MLKVSILIVLMAVYLVFGCPEWLMTGSPILRAFAYPLFHANVFHLLCNSLAVWTMFTVYRKYVALELFVGYTISCLVFPLATRPVVGISNLIFGIIGLRTPPFSMRKYWTNPTIIIFYVANVLTLFIPSISAVTHLAALFLGICAANAGRLLYLNETERK